MDSNLANRIRIAGEIIKTEIESTLQWIGLQVERDVVDYLEAHHIEVQGDLKKSITSQVEQELKKTILKVGSNIEYGIFVHEGTRPHWPPEAPIKRWVIKKFGYSGKKVEKVTRSVRFTISKKGTKAQPFLGFVLKQYEKTIVNLIASELKKRFA